MAKEKIYEGFVVGFCHYIENGEGKGLVVLDCDCGRSDEIQMIFETDEMFEYRNFISMLNPIRITLYRGHRSWKVRKIEEIEVTDKMLGYDDTDVDCEVVF